jgi:hypothetical protein
MGAGEWGNTEALAHSVKSGLQTFLLLFLPKADRSDGPKSIDGPQLPL